MNNEDVYDFDFIKKRYLEVANSIEEEVEEFVRNYLIPSFFNDQSEVSKAVKEVIYYYDEVWERTDFKEDLKTFIDVSRHISEILKKEIQKLTDEDFRALEQIDSNSLFHPFRYPFFGFRYQVCNARKLVKDGYWLPPGIKLEKMPSIKAGLELWEEILDSSTQERCYIPRRDAYFSVKVHWAFWCYNDLYIFFSRTYQFLRDKKKFQNKEIESLLQQQVGALGELTDIIYKDEPKHFWEYLLVIWIYHFSEIMKPDVVNKADENFITLNNSFLNEGESLKTFPRLASLEKKEKKVIFRNIMNDLEERLTERNTDSVSEKSEMSISSKKKQIEDFLRILNERKEDLAIAKKIILQDVLPFLFSREDSCFQKHIYPDVNFYREKLQTGLFSYFENIIFPDLQQTAKEGLRVLKENKDNEQLLKDLETGFNNHEFTHPFEWKEDSLSPPRTTFNFKLKSEEQIFSFLEDIFSSCLSITTFKIYCYKAPLKDRDFLSRCFEGVMDCIFLFRDKVGRDKIKIDQAFFGKRTKFVEHWNEEFAVVPRYFQEKCHLLSLFLREEQKKKTNSKLFSKEYDKWYFLYANHDVNLKSFTKQKCKLAHDLDDRMLHRDEDKRIWEYTLLLLEDVKNWYEQQKEAPVAPSRKNNKRNIISYRTLRIHKDSNEIWKEGNENKIAALKFYYRNPSKKGAIPRTGGFLLNLIDNIGKPFDFDDQDYRNLKKVILQTALTEDEWDAWVDRKEGKICLKK